MDISQKLENWSKHATNGQRRVLLEAKRKIDRLQEALKETLAVAKRNELGDYVQRAESALQQKDSE